jgi:6-phosphogluconate dehydrogenase
LEQIMEQTADIALIGLAVMGQNLIMNMNDHGYTVVAYNRTTSKVDEFLNDAAKGRTTILGAHSIEEMVKLLKRPRKIMLMVKAGKPVDEFIETLLPHLEPGDLIIDGGNSHFPDTIRRTNYLESKGLLFIGTGVSGGEEGARFGPSMMPGGSVAAWPLVKDIFQAICAKTPEGEACCEWVGRDGAGHYVKMVHNGIEYGIMQAYAEGFDIFKNATSKDLPDGIRYDLNLPDIAEVWRRGSVVSSWLLDLTAMALTENPTLSEYEGYVQDSGEGRWTIQAALEEAVPADVLTAALYVRFRSRQQHTFAEKMLSAMRQKFGGHVEAGASKPKKSA